MALSFTKHPHEVGETYGEHFGVASSFGFAMLRGGLACMVHAFLPFLCTSTGSRTIKQLHERMVTNRVKHAAPAGATLHG